jgi:ABC-type enterochelin transport system permease subunit
MAKRIWILFTKWLKNTSVLSLGILIGVIYGSVISTVTTFYLLKSQVICGQ